MTKQFEVVKASWAEQGSSTRTAEDVLADGRLAITRKEREDVVDARVARLDHETEVGGEGTAVRGAAGLIVPVIAFV